MISENYIDFEEIYKKLIQYWDDGLVSTYNVESPLEDITFALANLKDIVEDDKLVKMLKAFEDLESRVLAHINNK